MRYKIMFIIGITYLVIGCNSSVKKNVSDCGIVKIDVEQYFSNQNLTYSNEKIKFKISYCDTLNDLKKIDFTFGENEKQISCYLYQGHILEKYYSDSESLLLANLDTSIIFGVKKLLPSIVYPQKSTASILNSKAKKKPYKSLLWGLIDFHNSGNLGNTYVISTKINKNEFSLISFNLLVDESNLYLESFTLDNGRTK